jgi:hypothetical protein
MDIKIIFFCQMLVPEVFFALGNNKFKVNYFDLSLKRQKNFFKGCILLECFDFNGVEKQ